MTFYPYPRAHVHLLFLKIFVSLQHCLNRIDPQRFWHDAYHQGFSSLTLLALTMFGIVLYHGFRQVFIFPIVFTVLPWSFCKNPSYFACFSLSFTPLMQGVFAKMQGVFTTICRQKQSHFCTRQNSSKRQMTDIFLENTWRAHARDRWIYHSLATSFAKKSAEIASFSTYNVAFGTKYAHFDSE